MTRCGPSAVGSLRRWLPPTMPRRSSASTPRSWSFASNFPCRLKSEISDLKSEISNLESRISNLKSQISNLKSEISNLKSPSHAQEQDLNRRRQSSQRRVVGGLPGRRGLRD